MKITKIPLQRRGDERGLLIALEEDRNIPFAIKRVYYMFDTQPGIRRGFHSHKMLQQIAICVRGSCIFHFDNGHETQQISLNDPAEGLMIEPGIWHEMYDFSDDCILMVLADDFYVESDYIRDYDDFLRSVNDR